MKMLEFIALLIGTGGGTAWLTAIWTKKRSGAEADKILGEAYGDLIKNLQAEIGRLSDRVNNQEARELRYLEIISTKDKTELGLRTRIKDLENEIKALSSEIITLRIINDKPNHG